jgi:hypothetical protein
VEALILRGFGFSLRAGMRRHASRSPVFTAGGSRLRCCWRGGWDTGVSSFGAAAKTYPEIVPSQFEFSELVLAHQINKLTQLVEVHRNFRTR